MSLCLDDVPDYQTGSRVMFARAPGSNDFSNCLLGTSRATWSEPVSLMITCVSSPFSSYFVPVTATVTATAWPPATTAE